MQTGDTKPLRHFTDLKVWQKSHRLFLGVFECTERFPRSGGARIIADQVLRSCGSISANIAEGFNARSTREYIRFLDIARRSTAETENWTFKICDCGLQESRVTDTWVGECTEIAKMLNGLIRKLQQTKRGAILHPE